LKPCAFTESRYQTFRSIVVNNRVTKCNRLLGRKWHVALAMFYVFEPIKQFVILSSHSAFEISNNLLILFIRNILQYLTHFRNCRTSFVWVLAHAGIPDNEIVDHLAHSTPNLAPHFRFLTHVDLLSHLRHL